MHAHMYTMHKMRLRRNAHVSPPRLEPGKMWHGLSINQGAAREHDDQYQMLVGTSVSSDLRHNRWYLPLQLSQNNI